MSLRTPLEIGLGRYMGRYYASLVADTRAMSEYVARGLEHSIAWVPGRMIDKVEAMIKEYRKNQNEPGPGLSSALPIVLIALSKDFTPAPADWGVAVGSPIDVRKPDDSNERAYKLRLSVNEYRAQVVFISPEVHSAHSLSMQFHMFANGDGGRRFTHVHEFAGMEHEFPAMLETIDLGAVSPPDDVPNLTILIADINIRATIPLFQAPKGGEPNDGKPAPAGYPVVVEVDAKQVFGWPEKAL